MVAVKVIERERESCVVWDGIDIFFAEFCEKSEVTLQLNNPLLFCNHPVESRLRYPFTPYDSD